MNVVLQSLSRFRGYLSCFGRVLIVPFLSSSDSLTNTYVAFLIDLWKGERENPGLNRCIRCMSLTDFFVVSWRWDAIDLEKNKYLFIQISCDIGCFSLFVPLWLVDCVCVGSSSA